jgi:hypothetical protein
MAYAVGIYSKAICDRCGFRYDYLDLREEWNGLKVCPECYETKHPQLEPISKPNDPQALFQPRVDVTDDNNPFLVFTTTGKDIIPSTISDLDALTGSVGTVTVTGSIATNVTASVTAVTGTSSLGTSAYTGQIFAVTVAEYLGANKYFIDGTRQATVNLTEGQTYRFDQSDSTNNGHPLRFSLTSDGTHGGGSEYTTGVTTSGTPGYSGAYTEITVAASVATLYYYCTNHSGMGGQANTP